MKADIEHFRMPRYREIPGIGLYLDQTIKYLNVVLTPLGCVECTPSMVSNYVKKGYISKPVKKQYSEEQIVYLIFIMVTKLVLSMDHIEVLFRRQRETASLQVTYDAFCEQLETALRYTFGLSEDLPERAVLPEEPKAENPSGDDERLLRSVITTVSNAIYINHCFEVMK